VGRGPEVRRKSVLTASQQETSAHIQVLLSSLEDLGCLLHPGGMAAAPEKKLAESLSRLESYSWWAEDHPAADKPKLEPSSSSSRTVAEGAIAHMHKLASASRRFRANDSGICRLQKPDEPDFSADHFD
jgi:hypothetical protein